jgi:hypothetical protein
VTITTNEAVEYVYIEDSNGRIVDGTSSYYSHRGSIYTWRLTIYPDTAGTYRVYAENGKGDLDSERFIIDFQATPR